MLDGNPIPLIDLSLGLSDEQLAAQVKHAVASVGFLHVKGTHITQQQVDRMFDLVSDAARWHAMLLPVSTWF